MDGHQAERGGQASAPRRVREGQAAGDHGSPRRGPGRHRLDARRPPAWIRGKAFFAAGAPSAAGRIRRRIDAHPKRCRPCRMRASVARRDAPVPASPLGHRRRRVPGPSRSSRTPGRTTQAHRGSRATWRQARAIHCDTMSRAPIVRRAQDRTPIVGRRPARDAAALALAVVAFAGAAAASSRPARGRRHRQRLREIWTRRSRCRRPSASRGSSATSRRSFRLLRDRAPRRRITQERQDARIANAIESFGPMRDAYRRRLRPSRRTWRGDAGVCGGLSRLQARRHRVRAAFAGRDGRRHPHARWTRYLVFGVDGMVRYHSGAREPLLPPRAVPRPHATHFGDCDAVWCGCGRRDSPCTSRTSSNPGATPSELLLDLPPDSSPTPSATRGIARAVERVLDSTDHSTSPACSRAAQATERPAARRGYYLGLLVRAKWPRVATSTRWRDFCAAGAAAGAEAVKSLLARARQGARR